MHTSGDRVKLEQNIRTTVRKLLCIGELISQGTPVETSENEKDAVEVGLRLGLFESVDEESMPFRSTDGRGVPISLGKMLFGSGAFRVHDYRVRLTIEGLYFSALDKERAFQELQARVRVVLS